jgi:hypothetical protein
MILQVKRTEILDVIPSIVPLVDCLGGLVRRSWW